MFAGTRRLCNRKLPTSHGFHLLKPLPDPPEAPRNSGYWRFARATQAGSLGGGDSRETETREHLLPAGLVDP